ncbi:MAG: helix-turn-helix domain-containing protein [Pseudomonadota bacterium]
MSAAGKRILKSAKQALAFAKSQAIPPGYRVRIPAEIDARAIRAKLGLTQREFAAMFGVSVGIVRDWEQGRRVPSAPARALLKIVSREPEAALRALAA